MNACQRYSERAYKVCEPYKYTKNKLYAYPTSLYDTYVMNAIYPEERAEEVL